MNSTDPVNLSPSEKDQFDKLSELFKKKEPLHPELQPWLTDTGSFIGKTLKHPLVIAVPYCEEWNAMYNQQLIHKKKLMEELESKEKWSSALFLTERPYRIEHLFRIADKIKSDEDYWKNVAWVYSDSENLWQVEDHVDFLLSCGRGDRRCMMEPEELAILDKLPQAVRVYRGHQGINENGFSWTLSITKAWWFATRFNQKGKVSMGFVNKDDIIAYLTGRAEYEIVALREDIQLIEPYKVPKLTPALNKVFTETKTNYKLSSVRSDHGPHHWRQVDRIGMALCDQNKSANRQIVRLFSLIHDHCRENEMEDPLHGHRAAEVTPTILDKCKIRLKSDDLSLLLEAIRHHNEGEVSNNPTIGTCWDADRLDLPRVGTIPDPKYLSTDVARNCILQI